MRLLSIVGARPQFVKLAPVSAALTEKGANHAILHTGQHYDASMSSNFFKLMEIPPPNISLEIGSGSHGYQTGRMLEAIDHELQRSRPDVVLTYGDTNSTLAGTLASTKLGIPVAHIEAGLRSFNRAMPEEQNRVATDHLSDVLFAPTKTAMTHLEREGLGLRSVLVGDVMTDVCLAVAARTNPLTGRGGIKGDFVIATIHRPSNTDSPTRLRAVLEYLSALPAVVVLAAHPRLLIKSTEHGIRLSDYPILVRDPLTYAEMVATLQTATAAVTDSGGLQKEAYLLGCPCTTLRTETEWSETLAGDANILDGDLTRLDRVLRPRLAEDRPAYFGDGKASRRIADFVTGEAMHAFLPPARPE